jgi:hypothetical protein
MQSMWVGDRLSSMEQLCIKSFLDNGHPFHLYTYGAVANVPEGATVLDANTILPASSIFKTSGGFGDGSYAGFADLFRFKLLMEKGSWWVDTDVICLKPFEFAGAFVLTGAPPIYTNAIMRVPTNSIFASWLYTEAERRRSVGMAWGTIGTRLITEAIATFGMQGYLYPHELFYPIDDHMLIASGRSQEIDQLCEGSVGIHCYNELWRQSGRDKDGNYPADCLYERLLRKFGIRN